MSIDNIDQANIETNTNALTQNHARFGVVLERVVGEQPRVGQITHIVAAPLTVFHGPAGEGA